MHRSLCRHHATTPASVWVGERVGSYHGDEAEGGREDDGRVDELVVAVTRDVVNQVLDAHGAQDEGDRLQTYTRARAVTQRLLQP